MMGFRFPGADWSWTPPIKAWLKDNLGEQGDLWDAITVGFVRFLIIKDDPMGMVFALEFTEQPNIERLSTHDVEVLVRLASKHED